MTSRPSAKADLSVVDVFFQLRGPSLPADHGYSLYAAISACSPLLHRADWLGIHPVRGRRGIDGVLRLGPHSHLGLRLPAAQIPEILSLTGRELAIDGHRLLLAVPRVESLSAAASLDARIVIVKLTELPKDADGSLDKNGMRARYEAELGRQLAALGIGRKPELLGLQEIRVAGRRVLGFSVRVSDLDAESSLALQRAGLGGKRRMGCGVFVPTRPHR